MDRNLYLKRLIQSPEGMERLGVEWFIAAGYRRTSRKHLLASRIDRPDWMMYMAKEHSPWDTYAGMRWVIALGAAPRTDQYMSAPAHYRAVYSKDTIHFPYSWLKLLPNSNHDPVGYVELPHVRIPGERALEIC